MILLQDDEVLSAMYKERPKKKSQGVSDQL